MRPGYDVNDKSSCLALYIYISFMYQAIQGIFKVLAHGKVGRTAAKGSRGCDYNTKKYGEPIFSLVINRFTPEA